jgi:hypothetical protein
MSVLSHFQTSIRAAARSAVPLTGIVSQTGLACFVPEAEVTTLIRSPVGAGHDGLWNTHAKRRRCLRFNASSKTVGCWTGISAGLVPLEYLVDIPCR